MNRNNQKVVLFLCAETFPPQYAFLEYVFNDILPKHGYKFVWIMPSIEIKEITKAEWNSSSVWLIPKVRSSGLIGLFRDYIAHFRYIREAVHQALEEGESIDIVQVRDDPVMAHVAWRLSKKLGIPFVYQISHLKEEENILYAKMKLYGNPVKNYLKGKVGLLMRNWLLKKADLIFPISERMKVTLSQYGIPQERMVPLPEGVDTSTEPAQFDKAAKEIRRNLGLEDKQVLVYIGTMNRFRQLDFLLRVLQLVQGSITNAHLLMVGDGRDPGDLPWLKKKAQKLGIEKHVTFTGMVPRSKVPAYIRAADVGLSPFPPNPVLINNSPIKILEYLALEVPSVASDIPSQRQVIGESQGGICAPHEEQAFVKAIERLLTLPKEERKALGKRGREYVKAKRDFSVLATQLMEIYREFFGISPVRPQKINVDAHD